MYHKMTRSFMSDLQKKLIDNPRSGRPYLRSMGVNYRALHNHVRAFGFSFRDPESWDVSNFPEELLTPHEVAVVLKCNLRKVYTLAENGHLKKVCRGHYCGVAVRELARDIEERRALMR